jgi:alanine-synthesizing transaminase
LFSRRSSHSGAPTPFAELVQRFQREGRVRYDLSLSNPTLAALPYADLGVGCALGAPGAHQYQPACLGDARARTAVAELWRTRGVNVTSEQIALTASTSEAYSLLFKLLCDPGSAVLVPAPSYPLFDELARYDDVELVPYRLAYDGAWHIDFDSVERAFSDRVKALITVSPNNPTGSFTTGADAVRLAKLGVPIISDEVFWAYPLDANFEAVPSVLAALGDAEPLSGSLFVALDGLSKYAALPGLKLGWMTLAGDRMRVTEAMARLEFILDAYLSVNAPVQRALPNLLRLSTVTRVALRERLALNLAQLDRKLAGSVLGRLRADAGWSVVLRAPRVVSDFEWVSGLLENEGVLVQPGLFYDFEQEGFLVVSLLPEPTTFNEGLERLVDYVRRVSG